MSEIKICSYERVNKNFILELLGLLISETTRIPFLFDVKNNGC